MSGIIAHEAGIVDEGFGANLEEDGAPPEPGGVGIKNTALDHHVGAATEQPTPIPAPCIYGNRAVKKFNTTIPTINSIASRHGRIFGNTTFGQGNERLVTVQSATTIIGGIPLD